MTRRPSLIANAARSLALLLLLLQALVVPAHRHVGAGPTVAASGTTIAAPTKQSPDHPADCPICREVAHSGQYLSPGDLALRVTTSETSTPAEAMPASAAASASSHSWRSRAPPVSASI